MPQENKGCPNAKHAKYRLRYQPSQVYWGLGIEHEVYLEVYPKMHVLKSHFLTHTKPERYSHNYLRDSYRPGVYEAAVQEWLLSETSSEPHQQVNPLHPLEYVEVPVLVKSHSFLKTDIHNEAQTVYSKTTPPNPTFSGKTLLESLQAADPYFVETYNREWLFDGDTMEFNTLAFFNTTVDDVVQELADTERTFVRHLNAALVSLPQKHPFFAGPIRIMQKNYPFAKYMTNLNHVSMFNNGTMHFNLTLPTLLDEHCRIVDMPRFTREHQRAVRAIQWIEPLLVAVYGSGDPFARVANNSTSVFSKASQRCAVSRYVSMGTYNSDVMLTGKHNTGPFPKSGKQWFHMLSEEENGAYLHGLDNNAEIGMDLNFHKHHNHGIEIRFLDHVTEPEQMREIWNVLAVLMDVVLDDKDDRFEESNPIFQEDWNRLALHCLVHGSDYALTAEECALYERVFGIRHRRHRKVKDVLAKLHRTWTARYGRLDWNCQWTPVGDFSKRVLTPRTLDVLREQKLIRAFILKNVIG
jgi:hypothetical protein